MSHAETKYISTAIEKIYLHTLADNAAAIACYEKQNFFLGPDRLGLHSAVSHATDQQIYCMQKIITPTNTHDCCVPWR